MNKQTGTKQVIADVARDLFHEQGVHATGIEEILRRSGTGKSQFYHHFKSKDDLVHEVMQQYVTHARGGGVGGKAIGSWRDLEAWFEFFVGFQKSYRLRRSCPVGTIGSELRADQTLLRGDACEFFDCLRSVLSAFFQSRKDKGELSRSCDVASLADFCLAVVQGGLLMAKIRRDPEPFERSVKHALKYLRSLRRPLRDAACR